jgi:sulfur carrier protein
MARALSETVMIVKVNGEDRELAPASTLLDVLKLHNLTPDKVAIELNRRLVRSINYNTELKEGDQVEIVTFVGGG